MVANNFVSRWYGIGIVLMILMVAVGGITRLTQSGLSIVEWEPIKGVFPPLNESAWEEEFERYKEFPEFKKNKFMTIESFKKIYFWEYIHRILGRIIGLFFLIPLCILIYKKKITREQIKSTFKIILLIVFQAILGWYMVKSGLSGEADIAPIRLMMHFLAAMFLICYTYIQYLRYSNYQKFSSSLSVNNIFIITQLIFIQIIYGTFTAALDSGYMYNTFPLMDGAIMPFHLFEGKGVIENLFHSPASVQYIHRLLGTILLIIAIFLLINRLKVKSLNSIDLKLSVLILCQFLLGVFTLISNMNIYIAIAHQINACFILLICTQIIYQKQISNK